MRPEPAHVVRLGDESFTVRTAEDGALHVDGLDGAWHVTPTPDGGWIVAGPGGCHRVLVLAADDHRQVFVDGEFYDLRVEPAGRARRSTPRVHAESLTVPMPARVVKVLVSAGQAVRRGDVVIKLEAMKMELPLRAPRDGTVRAIACREGELVQPGASLLEIA